LIKVEGLRSLSIFRREFGDKVIVADLKTMDTGYLEAKLAFEFGADYTTVMGVSDIGTIEGVLRASREYGRGVMVDLMNVRDVDWITTIDGLGPDYFVVHSGIDMQARGVSPFSELRNLIELGVNSKLGVAGGINSENVGLLGGLPIDLIIVGGYITKADDPGLAAKKLYEAVSRLFE
jgi:3-hexulose-6-phosphate synthase